MRVRALIVSLAVLLLLPVAGRAERYAYPGGDTNLFSVEIPNDWSIEAEDDVLHSGPPDGSIYLGLWALDSGGDDVAGEAVEEIVSAMVRDYAITDEGEGEVDGIPLFYFEGSGASTDGGSPINFSVAIFSPDGQTFCTIIYFGSPDAERRHQSTLEGIVMSIRRE